MYHQCGSLRTRQQMAEGITRQEDIPDIHSYVNTAVPHQCGRQRFFKTLLLSKFDVPLGYFEKAVILLKHIQYVPLSSVQFSRSVVSDSLRPHEPQHARPPCPSPTPGVHPNPYHQLATDSLEMFKMYLPNKTQMTVPLPSRHSVKMVKYVLFYRYNEVYITVGFKK